MKARLMGVIVWMVAGMLGAAAPVTVKDGWFIVDGEEFFVKGVCFFENHTVDGKFRRSTLEEIDFEFGRIKECGFNAVRSQLHPKELALARKHGLMVMQSGSLFFEGEFRDSLVIQEECKKLKEIAGYSKDFDNILYCIVGNEPQIADGEQGIYPQGAESANQFYRAMVKAGKVGGPNMLFSMASCPPDAILDFSMFDCVSLNLYPNPTAEGSLGYRGYAEWFRLKNAGNKPFIFSEYGWRVDNGLGEFSSTMMKTLDEQLDTGATGAFFYTWRAFGEETNNDWFGILPTQGKNGDYKNAPRPIYEDFKKYFQAVIVEPKSEGKVYVGSIPVKVYGNEKTRAVDVQLDGKKWDLKKAGKFWWKADLPVQADRNLRKTLRIMARGEDGQELVSKERKVWVGKENRFLTVRITPSKNIFKAGETYVAQVIVSDEEGRPMPNRTIRFGINQTGKDLWTSELLSARTGSGGEYQFTRPGIVPGFFTLMAEVEHDDEFVNSFGDAQTTRVDK